MLLVAGILLWGIVVIAMARMLLSPPRMTDGKAVYFLKRLSPGDLGLNFEDVKFEVRDERDGRKLKIAAWWIPASGPSAKCAILIHGYADAKVGGIAWSPLLHSLGFNLLAIDLRAHGESGGRETTAGYWERHDVEKVMDQMRQRWPGETREVILFGVSLGAAIAAAVGERRDDIKAVILESPYADYRSAVRAHAKLMGMPGELFVRPGIRMAEWLSGANFEAVKPVDLIAKVKGRVMLIAAGDDPLVGDRGRQLEAAVKARSDGSVYWNIPEAYHVEGMGGDFHEYRRRVQAFLSGTG